jgi:ABC-type nitrate/sulfonate/bicarbonate transport system ATPase subunit
MNPNTSSGDTAAVTNRLKAIKLENVTVAYNGHPAVTDVSFSILDGETVSFLGSSGCGKTTILNVIAGFVSPSAGYAFANEREISGPGPDRAVVFQSNALFNWMTVENNITFSLRCTGESRSERKRIAEEMLTLVRLEKYGRSYPYQLSGGMRQRVGIARALAAKPKVILMDEPFAALDVQTRESLQEEVLRIKAQTNCTIICITHSVDEAVFMGDRIFLFSSRQPGSYDEFSVDLPTPRWSAENRLDARFLTLRNSLYRRMTDAQYATHNEEY